jgi:hypothetical protein
VNYSQEINHANYFQELPRNPQASVLLKFGLWCGGGDLNPYALRR